MTASQLVGVVDDDESVRIALIAALQSIGLRALGFNSAESFLEFNRLGEVGCLITDLRMPGVSGLELQERLQQDGFSFPVIFITAHGLPEDRAEALAGGAIAFLDKPFDDSLLLETVRRVIDP